jgi:ABC-2 type transport system permease protein
MRELYRHAALLLLFFKTSLSADLQYRMNFTVRIVTDIIWYASQIATFHVVYRYTPALGGWSLAQSQFFLAVLFLTDALWMLFFSATFDHFSDKVGRGELDYLLTKPINSQFFVSFQRIATPFVLNAVLSFVFLLWSYAQLPGESSSLRLLWLALLVPCGLVLTYGMRFFFSVSALVFTRADSLQYVWHQVYRLGMRPDSIFPLWLRYILLSMLPMAFVASVPARVVIEGPELWLIALAISLALGMVWVTNRFWRYCLRFYSSASS